MVNKKPTKVSKSTNHGNMLFVKTNKKSSLVKTGQKQTKRQISERERARAREIIIVARGHTHLVWSTQYDVQYGAAVDARCCLTTNETARKAGEKKKSRGDGRNVGQGRTQSPESPTYRCAQLAAGLLQHPI
jgi:hypothetical protein